MKNIWLIRNIKKKKKVLRKWIFFLFFIFRVNTNAKGMFFYFILVVFSYLYLDSEPKEKIFRLCLCHL